MFGLVKQPTKVLTDKDLEEMTLVELQQARRKRWASDQQLKRISQELARRDPLTDWSCQRCGREKYHEKEIFTDGSYGDSMFQWERYKFHAVICNYCGKSEFYNTRMTSDDDGFGVFSPEH